MILNCFSPIKNRSQDFHIMSLILGGYISDQRCWWTGRGSRGSSAGSGRCRSRLLGEIAQTSLRTTYRGCCQNNGQGNNDHALIWRYFLTVLQVLRAIHNNFWPLQFNGFFFLLHRVNVFEELSTMEMLIAEEKKWMMAHGKTTCPITIQTSPCLQTKKTVIINIFSNFTLTLVAKGRGGRFMTRQLVRLHIGLLPALRPKRR